MPKKPKKYYSDPETQRLIDEYAPYLSFPHVPTNATRGIIRALLEQLSTHVPRLNLEAAEGHLMAELLHDNHELEKARKRSESYSNEDQTPEEAASAEQFLADLICGERGSARVKKVLEEYASHSTDRMREESDEILAALAITSRNNQTRTEWVNAILPELLHSLKMKHACFSGCRANSTWPPENEEASIKITSPEEGQGPASVKNEILAYYHGLDALSVRRYLEGVRPKTVSRSSRPRS